MRKLFNWLFGIKKKEEQWHVLRNEYRQEVEDINRSFLRFSEEINRHATAKKIEQAIGATRKQ